jgi:hypothetical protein
MPQLLNKPYRITPSNDEQILALFNLMSTEKLSVLLGISTNKIVNRYYQLNETSRQENKPSPKNQRASI